MAKQVETTPIKLSLTDEQRAALKKAGVWMMEVELDRPDYSLTEMSRICDINAGWLRTRLKKGEIQAFKNDRSQWRVKAHVVATIWSEEVGKHLGTIERRKAGKKYQYRRPAEWAEHLFEKYLQQHPEISAEEKKIVRKHIKLAKAEWDKKYQEKLDKKAAKEAADSKK